MTSKQSLPQTSLTTMEGKYLQVLEKKNLNKIYCTFYKYLYFLINSMFTNIFLINIVDVFKISHVIYLNSRCVGTFDIINWFHGESVYPLLSYHLYIKYIYNVVELFCSWSYFSEVLFSQKLSQVPIEIFYFRTIFLESQKKDF